MSDQTTLVESAVPGGVLRGEFRRDGDRFLHRVLLGDPASPVELLRCCSPTEPLAGPTFQEVYRQETPTGGAIAFLTGMADGRYWSASVEAVGGDSPRLVFDLACRLKGQLGHVAVEYELSDGVEATLAGGELRLSLNKRLVAELRPAPVEGRPTAQLMLSGRIVMLAPGEGHVGDPRWAFEVAVGG